ncbi:MAG: methyl-accepting chemotaxis protein [Bacillota bacterium]
MKFTLRAKLIVTFLLLITIPMAVLGINSFKRSVDIMKNELEAGVASTLEDVNNLIEIYFRGLEENLVMLATDSSVEQIASNPDASVQMMDTFDKFAKSHPDILNVYIGTRDKTMYIYPEQTLPDGYDPTSRPWYQGAMSKNGLVWTEPYEDAGTKKMIISVAKPVYDSKNGNEFVGVMALDISLEQLSNVINSIKVGDKGYVILIDKSGNTITHPDKTLLNQPIPVQEIADAVAKDASGNVHYMREENGVMEEKIAIFSTNEKLGWKVMGTVYLNEIHTEYNQLLSSSLMIGLGALIAAILIAIFIANAMAKPIRLLTKDMERMKGGDFSVRCQVNTKDEIGFLAESFNIMAAGLKDMVAQVREVSSNVIASAETLAATTQQTSASAEQVSRSVEEIAKGATDQAGEAEKGASLVSGLASKFDLLSDRTKEMTQVSEKVMDVNMKGMQNVELLKDKTRLNNNATERIVTAVDRLDEQSKHIGSILETISSIAEQTNLLALNAAIEAARAGDAGRGFAVVAEEIRKLAEQSGRSADKINEIVVNIQQQTNETVHIMKEVKDRNKEQVMAVDDVNESFNDISQAIQMIGNKIEEINSYAAGMNKDGQQIVAAIENISAVSEETAASSEEVSASMQQQTSAIEEVARAAEHLNELAAQLNSEFSKFKI